MCAPAYTRALSVTHGVCRSSAKKAFNEFWRTDQDNHRELQARALAYGRACRAHGRLACLLVEQPNIVTRSHAHIQSISFSHHAQERVQQHQQDHHPPSDPHRVPHRLFVHVQQPAAQRTAQHLPLPTRCVSLVCECVSTCVCVCVCVCVCCCERGRQGERCFFRVCMTPRCTLIKAEGPDLPAFY